MKCWLCTADGQRIETVMPYGVEVTVLCVEHDLACLLACVTSDWSAVRDGIEAVMGPVEVGHAIRLASCRVIGLAEHDPGLFDRLRTVLEDMTGADDLSCEWAMLETMRDRSM